MLVLLKHYGVKWLFAIYMGKPVGSRFGQMASKIQGWQISSRSRVYHLYKSVPYTPKRPVHGKQPVCVCMCVFPGGLLFVSDQNDRQTESLSGQMVVILGGPLTGRYFKP